MHSSHHIDHETAEDQSLSRLFYLTPMIDSHDGDITMLPLAKVRRSRHPGAEHLRSRIVTMDSRLDASRRPRTTKSFLPRQLLNRRVAMAGNQVIVDHADRLHERVDDRRSDKLEAALRQLLRHSPRDRRFRRNLPDGLEAVDLRLAAEEIPQQI